MKQRLQRLAAVGLLLFGQLTAGLVTVPIRAFADTPYGVTLYNIPTADSNTQEITVGPDGALWFTEVWGNKVGRIATDGTITEYPVPTATAWPQSIVAGPDGALWFAENNAAKIGRITTAGAVTEFALPNLVSRPANITLGSDGNLWFSARTRVNGVDGYSMMRMTPSGVFSQFTLTPFTIMTSVTDVQAGMDGAIWFALNTQTSGSCTTKQSWIGRMTTSGAVTYYQQPTRCNAPAGITQGFDGAWWYTQSTANDGTHSIGRFMPPNTRTDYPVSNTTFSHPGPVLGSDGAVWFSENNTGKFYRITHTGVITEYPGDPSIEPSTLVSGPDGNIWFTEPGENKIGKFTLPSDAPFSGDLVYTKVRNAGGSTIEMRDLTTDATATLASNGGSQFYKQLVVNPDRNRLYYNVNITNPIAYQLKPGISAEGQAAVACETPTVSPDGKQLACYTLISGERRLKIVTLATYQETIVQIPGVDGSQFSPLVQPRLDWASNSSVLINLTPSGCSAAYIARINVDGSGFTQLTSGPCNGPGALLGRMSDDQSKIVFSNNNGLWLMNPDGTNQTLLLAPEPGRVLTAPAWSKDGKYLSASDHNPATPGLNSRLIVIDVQTAVIVKTYQQHNDFVFAESDWIDTYVSPDATAPTVTGTPDRTPNGADWYDADVTITWEATDPTPSSGTPTTPPPTVANQEGEHTYTSQPSCDPAGNCATGGLTLKIDKSAPTISYSLSEAPNQAGWHAGDVVVTFDCDDAVAGIVSCTAPVTVGEGANQVVNGTAVDAAGHTASLAVTLNVDKTKPTIAYTTAPAAPNAAGWFTSDVTVSFQCLDALSGVQTCSGPTTLTNEGEGQVVTGTAVDVAGNQQAISVTVNIDKSPPGLGTPSWTSNPKSVYQSSDLTVPAADTVSNVVGGEYFIGDTDPGQGNATAMTWDGTLLKTTFGTNLQPGVYKVQMRAQDEAGNWSALATDYLVVYDPLGFSITGRRTIVPSLANGDVLPGLIQANQDDKARFAFNVKYNSQGVISDASDLRFDYATGTKCNNPAQATNCHELKLNATTIEWLVVQGTNSSEGIFQGTATVTVDGVATSNPFRVTGLDGERLGPTSDDHFLLKIFAPGANPNTATPLYQVSQDVLRGNIRIRQ